MLALGIMLVLANFNLVLKLGNVGTGADNHGRRTNSFGDGDDNVGVGNKYFRTGDE